jgi:hypothetical protein
MAGKYEEGERVSVEGSAEGHQDRGSISALRVEIALQRTGQRAKPAGDG